MNRLTRWTTLATTLGFLALAAVAGADEEQIPVKSLPRAVIKAIKARFPEAEIEEAAEEEEDGRTIYEVSLEFEDQSIDVALKKDGTILEIEKEIPVDKLPTAVKKALAARYPEGKVAKVEEVTTGEHGPVHYEVSVTTEITFTARGKIVESEEEDEEDDKPAAKSGKSRKGRDRMKDKDDDDDEERSVKAKRSRRGGKDEDDDDKE